MHMAPRGWSELVGFTEEDVERASGWIGSERNRAVHFDRIPSHGRFLEPSLFVDVENGYGVLRRFGNEHSIARWRAEPRSAIGKRRRRRRLCTRATRISRTAASDDRERC